MAAALPGPRLRPHVKAHRTTGLARRQAAVGHPGFTCATIREVEGTAAAGLGQDLLPANEVLDARRLGALDAASRWRSTRGRRTTRPWPGVREAPVDVNVGLPRCGIAPDRAGWPPEGAEECTAGPLPAHVDPTVAPHERMHLVRGEEILDTWPVDLRGW